MSKVFLHLIFNVEWQPVLEEAADFSTILSVAIANWEKVTMFESHNVWRGDIGILICFIWVMSSNATFRGEGELCYNVAYFSNFVALRSSRFLRCWWTCWSSILILLVIGVLREFISGLVWPALVRWFLAILLHHLLETQLWRVWLDTLRALTSLSKECCIRSCILPFWIVSTLWAQRPRWRSSTIGEFLVASQRCDLFAGEIKFVLASCKTLISYVSEHFRAFNPSSASSTTAWLSAFLSFILLQKVAECLLVHRLVLDLWIWRLNDAEGVQRHSLMLVKLAPNTLIAMLYLLLLLIK